MFFHKLKHIFGQKPAPASTLTIKPDKDPKLTALRMQLLESIDRPENLVCPILQDVPNEAVITPNGHVFNKTDISSWIETHHACPLTREKLEVNDLLTNNAINNFIQQFSQEIRSIVDAINTMAFANEPMIRERIDHFNESMKCLDLIAQGELEKIRQATLIKFLINNLSLDLHNVDHLFFWHHMCNATLDDYEIIHSERIHSNFYIPRLVYDLMVIADNHYESQLKQALDERRRRATPLPNFSNKPLVCISSLFRAQTGDQIVQADDIESLRLY